MHKGALVIITILSLVGYGALVFASPNIPGGPLSGSGGFTAGTELDPDCAPNQVVPEPCLVKLPPGESTTVNNGLTLTGTNVQLGGTLVKDTDIIQGTKTLTSTFNGTNGSFGFVNGNYGPLQTVGMFYIPTATPYIVTGSTISEYGANLATRNYITTEQSVVSAWIDPGTGEHRSAVSAQASDASNTYAFTAFGQQGMVIMSEYNDNIDFTSKMIQIGSDSILQQLSYSRVDNQNYLYNQAVMDDSSLSFSVGNSVVAGVFSGSGKEYKLSNIGHEFKGLDLFANQYSSTRDDSGIFTPVNFLYTDSSGKILSAPTSLLGGGGWALTGNAGTDGGLTNFVGTTDAQDFVVKTNGNQVARFGQNGNVAIGRGSILFGLAAPDAVTENSFAVGPGAVASNTGPFAIGAYAIGVLAQSSNSGSVAIGTLSNASGIGAIAIGPAISSSQYSIAIGQDSTASNKDSVAIGRGSIASGSNSLAMGISSNGDYAIASGDNSVAIGEGAHSYSSETSMGRFNTAYVPVIGLLTNRLFTLGDGTGDASRSDAFTILKNGKTGIGYDNFETTAFDSLLQVNGSILSANLPSTKDDSGTFAPVNFLYTDSDGKILSAPTSLLGGGGASLKWYAENAAAPTTTPTATGLGSIAMGDGARALANSMFVYGTNAGKGAINSSQSFFIGDSAGRYESGLGLGTGNANNAIFIGNSAGYTAADTTLNNTGAHTSILIGDNTSTGGFSDSIAIGKSAVNKAANQLVIGSTTSPISSVFIGDSKGTASSSNTVFIGNQAGLNATSATRSIFLGQSAGSAATNASGSFFVGFNTGLGATNANNSNFIGAGAGQSAAVASNSNFIGNNAGKSASGVFDANFIGAGSGQNATNATNSNFFGFTSGNGATSASNSNFIGYSAGFSAVTASNSNFVGFYAGINATNASNSNFIGKAAGSDATNSFGSIFIGNGAGSVDSAASRGTTRANNSIFIGTNAGGTTGDFTLNNSAGRTSILIGDDASTGGFSNSIAIGKSARNTAMNQFMIGSTVTPVNEMVVVGNYSGGGCTFTVSGMTCSSDERLKTNIVDLDDTALDSLLKLKTVTYNWKENPHDARQIGFLAQDMQQYFPELVTTGYNDYLQVNYAGMTPVLTKAIQELNIKLSSIESVSDTLNPTFIQNMRNWFADAGNGITKLFAHEVETEKLCVKKSTGVSVCITGDELDNLLNQNQVAPVTPSSNNLNNGTNNGSESNTTDGVQNPSETPVENVPTETIVDPQTTNNPSAQDPQPQNETPLENNL